jgi:ABC-2 type transport system permease protein
MSGNGAGYPARGSAFMRLRGLVRKEAYQILRDPSSLAIAFVLPLILLFIFGYGISLDAKHVPVALVIENPTAEATDFAASFEQSEYFKLLCVASIQEAEQAVLEDRVNGIVWLRGNFSRDFLGARPAPISVIVNGVDANTGRILQGYLEGVWSTWLLQYAAAHGQELKLPVNVEHRVWFNPALRSRDYLVPGLLAVIMTLIGALLTALVVAREWERGTMEALLVTPVRVREILLGKFIPYFFLGMGGLLLSVGMTVFLFEVPLRGSLWVLLAASALFLCAALGMGLLISTVAKNQFIAGQVAILATFLPAFILSGFIFNIGSMPAPIQVLTHAIAARYFVAILQTVFLAGNIWSVIVVNALALVLIAGFFLAQVRRLTRKRLE